MQRDIVFLVNLLQDVNILRGLVYLARRETDARLRLMVSSIFRRRDTLGIWTRELDRLAADTGAEIADFGSSADLLLHLQGRGGLILAASESQLNGHKETRDAFRIAPSSYLKITLQHGLECIGFLQSREHVIAHGRDITFNADVLCGWQDRSRLTSLTVPNRDKLYVTGPPTLLQRPIPHPDHPPLDGGLVCENMHSARLSASGDHKASFMDTFFAFCARLAGQGRRVTLRPHPGGQYVLKNKVALPNNVHLNNLPIYDVDLSGYRYGISAPSTIVLDMALANIPVAVWRDGSGVMDAGNYDGLAEISDLEDWLAFAREAEMRPRALLERQGRFLDGLGLVRDPDEVYRRFARLMVNGLATIGGRVDIATAAARPPAAAPARPAATEPPRRVLFIANALLPTLQLSFLKPLAPLVAEGRVQTDILTELDMVDVFGKEFRSEASADWLIGQCERIAPDVIVCCRYSGPHPRRIARYAQSRGIPLIYHVDDDLLNIPPEIGEKKYLAHNKPNRLLTVRTLMEEATLVYCSNQALKRRFRSQGFTAPMVAGEIYCASRIYRAAQRTPVRRIGYMGFGHEHDFEGVLPALERYLERNSAVELELFGSIPRPDTLARFGSRVSEVPPVRDYGAFRQALADREWAIGICPLVNTPFNAVKANTKWVEYTSSGMAVIASKGLIYDDCAGGGRGILVTPDEWDAALQALTDDPELRYRMVVQAQAHLALHYSDEKLQRQVLDVLDTAAAMAGGTVPA